MKPQSAAFLAKAHEFLNKAQELFDAHHWPDEAGRAAYLAGLHAAQALIFETTGRAPKRHPTVHREFRGLVRNEPRVDDELRAFLSRAYNLKAIADYETGEARVTTEQAQEALQTAIRFVETVVTLLPPNGPAARVADAPKPTG